MGKRVWEALTRLSGSFILLPFYHWITQSWKYTLPIHQISISFWKRKKTSHINLIYKCSDRNLELLKVLKCTPPSFFLFCFHFLLLNCWYSTININLKDHIPMANTSPGVFVSTKPHCSHIPLFLPDRDSYCVITGLQKSNLNATAIQSKPHSFWHCISICLSSVQSNLS